MTILGAGASPFVSKSDLLEQLQERILTGALPSGRRLPSERELAEEFGVSRPVVRETLAGLAERGLVETHAGRGTFVRQAGMGDLSDSLSRAAARAGITTRHLVEARLMVEVEAARKASDNPEAGPAIFDALEVHEQATSLRDRAETDLAFHEAIARGSGNPAIALLFGAFRHQVLAMMMRSQSESAVRDAGEPHHRMIAQAISAGDAESAAAVMAEHISLALQLFGDEVDRPLREVLEDRGLGQAT